MARMIGAEKAQQLIQIWPTAKSLADAMEKIGIKTKDARAHNRYKRQVEERFNVTLPTINPKYSSHSWPTHTQHFRRDKPYSAIVFSDAHFWPGLRTPAYKYLLKLIDELKPDLVIDNGDSMDFASLSRHMANMWEDLPTTVEEYEACRDYLQEIEDTAKSANKRVAIYRNIGNHDMRLEARLANQLPELRGMPGTTIAELFPGWTHSMSVALNDAVIIKHRMRSAVHAAWLNTLHAGVSIVTGHTHRLTIRELDDYRGRRYGIETGTLADPYGPQFHYMEDNVRNWQSGFIVLTVDGDKIFPEKFEVQSDGSAFFRGEIRDDYRV